MNNDERRILTSSPRYTCRTAADAFRAVLLASNANEQPQDPDLGVVQKQRFQKWCDSDRLYFQKAHFEGIQPGREHHIVDCDSFYLKITLTSRAGYHVTIDVEDGIKTNNSLPLDYLNRQALQTELFAVPCDFLGIIGEPHQFQLVVKQTKVRGDSASFEDIRQMMTKRGFTELPLRYAQGALDFFSFFNQNFAVFDLRPANVVQTAEGLCIPIDCFVTQIDEPQHRYLSSL